MNVILKHIGLYGTVWVNDYKIENYEKNLKKYIDLADHKLGEIFGNKK